jgi:magnesium-transporting ATPase (P-type)
MYAYVAHLLACQLSENILEVSQSVKASISNKTFFQRKTPSSQTPKNHMGNHGQSNDNSTQQSLSYFSPVLCIKLWYLYCSLLSVHCYTSNAVWCLLWCTFICLVIVELGWAHESVFICKHSFPICKKREGMAGGETLIHVLVVANRNITWLIGPVPIYRD